MDADQKIEEASFEGRGCAISVASASMMTNIVTGKKIAEVENAKLKIAILQNKQKLQIQEIQKNQCHFLIIYQIFPFI